MEKIARKYIEMRPDKVYYNLAGLQRQLGIYNENTEFWYGSHIQNFKADSIVTVSTLRSYTRGHCERFFIDKAMAAKKISFSPFSNSRYDQHSYEISAEIFVELWR